MITIILQAVFYVKDKFGRRIKDGEAVPILALYGPLCVNEIDAPATEHNSGKYAITHLRSTAVVRRTDDLKLAMIAAREWSKLPVWDFETYGDCERWRAWPGSYVKQIQAALEATPYWKTINNGGIRRDG